MTSTSSALPTPEQCTAAISAFFADSQRRGLKRTSQSNYDDYAANRGLPDSRSVAAAHGKSWARAVQAAGHRALGRRPSSPEDSLRDFKAFAIRYRRAHGPRLTERLYEELRDKGEPSSSLLRLHYGTWSGACARVGLQTGRAPRPPYLRSTVHGAIEMAASRAGLARGVAPTVSEYDRHRPEGAPSSATIKREEGRWLAVCHAANLRPRVEQLASSRDAEVVA